MSYDVKLPIGCLGISQAAIVKDKWGEASIHYIPPGAKTKAELGSHNIHALEDIRENRDIIIVDANNGAIEHTPQELKYMNRADQWQQVNEDFPLPTTMSSRAGLLAVQTVTAAGNTALATPSVAAKKIRLLWFLVSNEHAVAVVVGLRFGNAGRIMRFTIPPTGLVVTNLVDANHEGAIGEVLNAWANAAYAGGVDFNVIYREDV